MWTGGDSIEAAFEQVSAVLHSACCLWYAQKLTAYLDSLLHGDVCICNEGGREGGREGRRDGESITMNGWTEREREEGGGREGGREREIETIM